MKKVIHSALLLIVISLLLCSCSNNRSNPTINVDVPTSEAETTSTLTTEPNQQTTVPVTDENTEPDETVVTTTSEDKKNEKMVFSSDPSNPFIQAVVGKYGVSADRLVAYYANSMTTNGNLVFEFDGSKDANGKAVRNKDTLKNIYTVSQPPELIAKKATGTAAEGNEYTEKESKLCQTFTEQVVFRFFSKELQNA